MDDLNNLNFAECVNLELIEKENLRIYTIKIKFQKLIQQGFKSREAVTLLTKTEIIRDEEIELRNFFIKQEYKELIEDMSGVDALNCLAKLYFRSYDTIRKIIYPSSARK